MGKEKYILDFNKSLFDKEITELNKQVEVLNSKEQLYAELSKHTKQEISSILDFEKYLGEKTGFVNLFLASQALDLDKQYNHALELEKTEVIAKNKVSKKGSKYALKSSLMDDLRERHTSYIEEVNRLKYDALCDALKVINALPLHARGCIRQNINAEWVINKYRFNSKD